MFAHLVLEPCRVGTAVFDKLRAKSVAFLEKRQQKMRIRQLLVCVLLGNHLCAVDRFDRFLCKVLSIHISVLLS